MVTLLGTPVGDRIAWYRRALDISQKELARRIGVSSGYPTLVENGYNCPSRVVLKRMSVVLGAPFNELAHLAGYSEETATLDHVDVPPEYGQRLRRLARFPLWAIDWALQSLDGLGDRVWFEDAAEDRLQQGPDQQRHEGRQPEDPNAQDALGS